MREIKWILGQCEDSLQVLCTVIGAVGFYAFFTVVAFENIGWEAGVMTLIVMMMATALICRLPGVMEEEDTCGKAQGTVTDAQGTVEDETCGDTQGTVADAQGTVAEAQGTVADETCGDAQGTVADDEK